MPLKVIVGFFVCNLVSKFGRDEVATKMSSLLLYTFCTSVTKLSTPKFLKSAFDRTLLMVKDEAG